MNNAELILPPLPNTSGVHNSIRAYVPMCQRQTF